VLLLDEPFSALDDALRADLRAELKRLQRDFGVPIVFVTHDLREAHLLADSVAVIDEGRVLQLAPRDDVFRRPTVRRVRRASSSRPVPWCSVPPRQSSGLALLRRPTAPRTDLTPQ